MAIIVKRVPTSQLERNTNTYRYWRNSVLEYYPNAFIGKPTMQELRHCAHLRESYYLHFRKDGLATYINIVVGNFDQIKLWAKSGFSVFIYKTEGLNFPTLKWFEECGTEAMTWFARNYGKEYLIRS